jgi:hypothetical protein
VVFVFQKFIIRSSLILFLGSQCTGLAAGDIQTLPEDTLTARQERARLIGLGIGFSTAYAGGMYLLHREWYKHDTPAPFRWYNDNRDWNQMDKASHMHAAFHQSRIGVDALKWAGVAGKKAIWYGGMLGIIMQTPIELFDGFSSEYGASVGDLVANTVGSAGVIAQHLTWGELRLIPKFSYRPSAYDPLRMTVLGESFMAQMVRDYNGHTYWLSADVSAFMPAGSRFPRWLSVAAGYGAGDMVHADPDMNRLAGHSSYRRYFLSLDLNLMNIPTRSKVLKTVFHVVSIFRVPAPALEFRKQQFIFHPLFY